MTKKRFNIKATTFAKNGRVLAVAFNNYEKSHPIQHHFANLVGEPDKIFIHAEISAILKSGKNKIHRISVERYGNTGNPLPANPCKVCEAAIRAYGIIVVEHT